MGGLKKERGTKEGERRQEKENRKGKTGKREMGGRKYKWTQEDVLGFKLSKPLLFFLIYFIDYAITVVPCYPFKRTVLNRSPLFPTLAVNSLKTYFLEQFTRKVRGRHRDFLYNSCLCSEFLSGSINRTSSPWISQRVL